MNHATTCDKHTPLIDTSFPMDPPLGEGEYGTHPVKVSDIRLGKL